MPSGRKPDGDAALSNAERQARYRLRHQVGQPAVAAADGRWRADRRAGTMPSPSCSNCKAPMPPGSKHCLKRFRTRRRPMPCRPSSILTSTRSQRSSRHAATAATDETRGLAGHTAFSFCWARVTASRAALRTPAAPAAALDPVTPAQCVAVMPCGAWRVRRRRECHFYFARRVTFLSCADRARREIQEFCKKTKALISGPFSFA